MSDTFKNIDHSVIVNRSGNKVPTERSKPKDGIPEAEINMAARWKKLIAEDKIDACLEDLASQFQSGGNTQALNQVILLSGKFTEISLQSRYDQISPELFSREKARIREALLALIDANS